MGLFHACDRKPIKDMVVRLKRMEMKKDMEMIRVQSDPYGLESWLSV